MTNENTERDAVPDAAERAAIRAKVESFKVERQQKYWLLIDFDDISDDFDRLLAAVEALETENAQLQVQIENAKRFILPWFWGDEAEADYFNQFLRESEGE